MQTQSYSINSPHLVSIHLHGTTGFCMLIFSIFSEMMPSHTNIHKLYQYPTGSLLIKLATSCCHMISLNPQHMRGILRPCGWSVWGVCLQTCICPCVHWPCVAKTFHMFRHSLWGSPCPYSWPPPFPLLDNADGVLKAQKPSRSHGSCSPHSPLKIQASPLLKGLFCQGACASKGPHWKHICRLAKD